MISLEQLWQSWNSFFFLPVPVYTVALFRIVFGLVLLFDVLYNLPNLKEFLGPEGLINYTRYKTRAGKRAFSLFLYMPPTMRSVYLITGLHITSLIFMIAGLFTPLSVIITYLTLCSIVNRNPTICNGGDNVSRIMCFYLIFASSGHAYSLDEFLFYAPAMPGKEYLLQAPWAMRLMQIQLSVIYLNTMYWKLKGVTYRNGTALYYITENNNYRRFSVPEIVLRRPFVQLLTWGALLAEFALGIGIWIREFRNPLIIVGFGLHLTIEYILNVHLFSWYMMAVLLLFVDPQMVMNCIDSIF